MKKSKAFLLAAGSAVAGAVAAIKIKESLETEDGKRKQYDFTDKGISTLLKGIGAVLPKMQYPGVEEYEPDNTFCGHSSFLGENEGGKWRLGYAKVSLVPDDYSMKKYYIAGYLSMPPAVMDSVLDDQRFRCVCVDDSSGRGSVIFGSIDCVGISNTDISVIRNRLKDFARENNIVAINIAATHCHSAIDTQGLWGDLPHIAKTNLAAIKNNKDHKCVSGRDTAFMENLYEKCVESIKTAYNSMKEGRLLYAVLPIKHGRAKREPNITIDDIVKLHFVPDDGSKETVAVFMAAHPVSLGAKNTKLSADYIYYADEEFERADTNFVFFQGPQLAIASHRDELNKSSVLEDGAEGYQHFGNGLARRMLEVNIEEEIEAEPLLNVRVKKFIVPCENNILKIVAQLNILNNAVVKLDDEGKKLGFYSETGYAEIGKRLKIAFVPGELSPELVVGGTLSAEEAYNHEEWTLPPMKEMVEPGSYLVVSGLMNDSVGYILPDNNYGSVAAPEHYEEAVSAGPRTASLIVSTFADLVKDCKG